MTYFRRRYERELAAYDGPPPPPARNNAVGRRRWWSASGVGRSSSSSSTSRKRGRSRPRDAAVAAADTLPPPRDVLVATPDGILLIRKNIVASWCDCVCAVKGIEDLCPLQRVCS
jgi:hypothetical protein